jgi:hypothetical protein
MLAWRSGFLSGSLRALMTGAAVSAVIHGENRGFFTVLGGGSGFFRESLKFE